MKLLKKYVVLRAAEKNILKNVTKICLPRLCCTDCHYLNRRFIHSCAIEGGILIPKFGFTGYHTPNSWKWDGESTSSKEPEFIPTMDQIKAAINSLTPEELHEHNITRHVFQR